MVSTRNFAGAAAFFAMREYEKHQAENGNPPSHAFAKELMAGIAAAEVYLPPHCINYTSY